MGIRHSVLRSHIEENVLLKAGVVDLGIQWIGFAISCLLGTEKFYDLTGAATNLYLTWATLMWSRGDSSLWSTRHILQNSCVTLWAVRLGSYLFSRVISSGEDRRFRLAKQKPYLMLIYWTMQAVWIWMNLWPTLILNTSSDSGELGMRDYLGYALFATGFLFEVIADRQKSTFRANPDNKNKYISSGLWSISRHPNYFGEIMLWAGLFLPPSTVMSGNQWFSAITPFFVAGLITKVSGIPILEKYADKKWGGDADYQKYKRSTAKLIPFIW